ncbi:6996_t:CDS:2, partial [Dentiscutata heterogama]
GPVPLGNSDEGYESSSQSNNKIEAEIKRSPLNLDNIEVEIDIPALKPSTTIATTNMPNIDRNIVTECEFVRTTSTSGIGRQKRNKWTDLELNYLERGMEEYGTRWEEILKHHGKPHGPLRNRTAMNLKDKARNEKARRIRDGVTLGIFELATS